MYKFAKRFIAKLGQISFLLLVRFDMLWKLLVTLFGHPPPVGLCVIMFQLHWQEEERIDSEEILAKINF